MPLTHADQIANPSRLQRAGEVASRVASLRPEDPRLRRALYVCIGLILVLGVSFAMLTTLGQFPDLSWQFKPGWMLLAVLGFTLHVLATAEIWRRVLLALGPRLEPRPAVAIWCASALGRYVPTGLLMPLMRTAMAEREGVPKRICLASIVYELALAFTAAVLLGAYFVIDLPALEGVPERFLVLVFPVLALSGLHPRVFHRVADWVLIRLGRDRLPLALPMGRVLEFVGLYAGSLVIAGLALFALSQSIHPLDAADAVIVIGAFSAATALSLIAFILPGGLVAREAALAVALAPVMPTGPAIAIAVLARITQMAVEVVLASLAPFLLRRAHTASGTARRSIARAEALSR